MNKIKRICHKTIDKLKEVFSKKRNIVIAAIIAAILLIVILVMIFTNKKDNKFALNSIYNVYPEEVRGLYSNVVSVSCYGDLHFDMDVDSGIKTLSNIEKNNLLDYMFSYLEKNSLLNDSIEENVIQKTEKNLFAEDIDLVNEINDYNYNGYTYTLKSGKITRKKSECTSDNTYVSHLFGYSWDNRKLSMDVNVAYLKDGKLYNFNDEELGEYSGNASDLPKLTENTSYYRFNFIKDDGMYKLSSVEWKNRT